MFQKLKNLIDRYSWFVFIMMILVLFLNYIYPFDPSLSGLQLEWLIMTQVLSYVPWLLLFLKSLTFLFWP